MIDSFDNIGKTYDFDMTPEAKNDYDCIIDSMLDSPKTTKQYVDRFEIEVDTIVEILKDSPYIGRGLKDGADNIRYRSIPGYDYAIYYDIDDGKLDVIAFALLPERAGQLTIDGLLNERVNLLAAKKRVENQGPKNA